MMLNDTQSPSGLLLYYYFYIHATLQIKSEKSDFWGQKWVLVVLPKMQKYFSVGGQGVSLTQSHNIFSPQLIQINRILVWYFVMFSKISPAARFFTVHVIAFSLTYIIGIRLGPSRGLNLNDRDLQWRHGYFCWYLKVYIQSQLVVVRLQLTWSLMNCLLDLFLLDYVNIRIQKPKQF